jgi:hypothetical protein
MATKPFETTTNPNPKSLIDDQLKPTAEMHILVGGPYTDASGENHKYGHTALRIKTTKYDLTYDFGRYGKVSGTFGESGDGILRVWSSFQPYINGEIALNRKTTGFVYFIFDSQADLVKNYFTTLIAGGTELSGKSSATKKVYKLATDYHALGPNCTTLSLDGAVQAVPRIDDGSNSFNKPEEVLDWKERLALKAKGGATRLFLPANLLTFLNTGKPIRVNRKDIHGNGE